ncbi:MAG TPA: hypothetical protein VM143_13665 [Acidimicrobiales bacterium]|nr:hypothetical protein [Acidimicrobiales bacterium]
MEPTTELAPRLAGLDLRSALVFLLLDRGRPIPLAELDARIRRAGFDVEGRPGKAVSDALRWEVARGRVRRLGRGIYGPGVVAKVTKHRMRARVAATPNRARTRGPG